MLIKDAIKKARLNKNMTMAELGECVGVSKGTISRWESGNIASMKRDKIAKLCKALDVSPVVLVPGLPERNTQTRLTEQEQELLAIYRQLDAEQQNAVLVLVKSLAK